LDAMNEEGFEEWDADFLDQLIQVEELALCSSSAAAANQNPNPSQRLIHVEHQEPLRPVAVYSHHNPTGYSPPRELSQRNSDHDSFPRFSNAAAKSASSSSLVRRSDNAKELEIQRLKVRCSLSFLITTPTYFCSHTHTRESMLCSCFWENYSVELKGFFVTFIEFSVDLVVFVCQ